MTAQPQNLRGLKALVGIMAILIIIGTTVVIGTVIHRLYLRFNPSPASSITAASSAPILPSVPYDSSAPAIKLAEGDHIITIAPAGGDLAVLVATIKGEQILLINPASGSSRVILASQ